MTEEERIAQEKATVESEVFTKYGLKPGDHVKIGCRLGQKKSVCDGLTGRIHDLINNGACVEFDEVQEDASAQWFDFDSIRKIPD